MSGELARFERELQADPALVDATLAQPDVFLPVPAQLEPVIIRTDAASVDLALARAFALAVMDGILVRVELTDGRTDR